MRHATIIWREKKGVKEEGEGEDDEDTHTAQATAVTGGAVRQDVRSSRGCVKEKPALFCSANLRWKNDKTCADGFHAPAQILRWSKTYCSERLPSNLRWCAQQTSASLIARPAQVFCADFIRSLQAQVIRWITLWGG